MASALLFSGDAINAAAEAIGALLDNGKIEHRTGSPPASITSASTGTLLGTNNFSATAFGSASSGTVTANSISSDTSADASGTAGYFRCYGSGGTDTQAVLQGTSGESGDSPDLTFDNKTIVAGGTIAVSGLTITVPDSAS